LNSSRASLRRVHGKDMADAVSEEWEEFKDLGNEAFKAKQFTTAVQHFTKAIELKPGYHVLHSNRAGAYANLGKWRESLQDAEKCIELNKDFAKGYGRKGAAHEAMGDLENAKAAYAAGLAVDPNQQTIKLSLSAVESKMAARAAARERGGTEAIGADSPPMLNYAIVSAAIFYILPVLGSRIGFYGYRVCVILSAFKYARALYQKYGISRAVLQEMGKIMQDDNAHYLVLSLVLVPWRPVPFVIIPMVTYSVGAMVPIMATQLDQFPSFMRGFLQPKVEFMAGPEGQMLIMAFASTSEVMAAVTLTLSLFTGLRNIGILFIYLKFLSWRYDSSEWTKRAVWQLRDKAGEYAHHRYAPKVVGLVYEKIKQLIGAYYSRKDAKEKKAS